MSYLIFKNYLIKKTKNLFNKKDKKIKYLKKKEYPFL